MAYQVTRHKRVVEDLELTDENGKVVETLHIDLESDAMAKQLSIKHLALINAQRAMQTAQDTQEVTEKLETIGNAVTELLEAVFGKENTDKIVAFYDNRYIEMCQEVLPFVVNVIIPQVRTVAQESKNRLLESYGRKAKNKPGRK